LRTTLDLTIQVGECFGLLGPNGTSKTTTTEILEGPADAHFRRGRVMGNDVAGARTGVVRMAWDLSPGNLPFWEINRHGT